MEIKFQVSSCHLGAFNPWAPQYYFSGKFFKSYQFGTDKNGVIDYDKAEKLILKVRPKLIIIGTTSYPLIIDWKFFAQVADKVGSWLVADISHISGLVLAGVYPSPVKFAHIMTTTTHKTLRGPRGAMIMVTEKGLRKDPDVSSKIDRAVFRDCKVDLTIIQQQEFCKLWLRLTVPDLENTLCRLLKMLKF